MHRRDFHLHIFNAQEHQAKSISELRKVRAGKADPNVAHWVRVVLAGSLFLSVIVIQELEIATLLAERRDPPTGASTGVPVLNPWAPLLGPESETP